MYLKKYSRKTRWRDETFEFDILLTKWILSIYKDLKIYNENPSIVSFFFSNTFHTFLCIQFFIISNDYRTEKERKLIYIYYIFSK